MAEYIEREALMRNLKQFAPEQLTLLIESLIQKQPAEDVVEVVWCDEFDRGTSEVEWDDYPMNYAEAFETAINALERQTPKKPRAHTVDVDKLKIGNANWCKGTTVYRCPNCNDFISRIYDFCYKCGQKINWRDME